MSNLRKSLLSRDGKRLTSKCNDNCTPLHWTQYFQNEQKVNIDEDVFNVYTSGDEGPVLVLIHGGGYSALTWALFTEAIKSKIDCHILAVDLRGHGNTHTNNEDDLSLKTLAKDVVNVIETFYEEDVPPIILVGHSLGGAVAVDVSLCLASVIGLCVIDVVEGTALESLSSMQNILRNRPDTFTSIEQAIQWSFRSGQTHNIKAARISMPGQIKNTLTMQLAANENIDNSTIPSKEKIFYEKLPQQKSINTIEEEQCELNVDSPDCSNACDSVNSGSNALLQNDPVPTNKTRYVWRIDLSKTERYWTGWFKGLSQKFLDVQIPKVLLLANIHGLDTALTVGQMQGKFQLQVLPRSGHAIHEDQPHRVADIVAGFLVKQKLVIAKNNFVPVMPAC